MDIKVIDLITATERENEGKPLKILYALSFFQSSITVRINTKVLLFVVRDREELKDSIKFLESISVIRYSGPHKKYVYPLEEDFRLEVQRHLEKRDRFQIVRKQCLRALVELFERDQCFKFHSFVSVLKFSGEYQALMEDLCELPEEVISELLSNNRIREKTKCFDNLNEIYNYYSKLLTDNAKLKGILYEYTCGLEVEGRSRDEIYASVLTLFLDLAILYSPDYFLTPSTIEAVLQASKKMLDLLKFKEAIEGYRLVFEDQQMSSATDEVILEAWREYAEALTESKRVEESLEVLGGLLKRLKEIDVNHASIPAVERSIGSNWMMQNDLEEAMKYFQEALVSGQSILGEKHKETLKAKREIAFVLQHQGKTSEALEILRKLAPEFVEVFGEMHVETMVTFSDSASIFFYKKNFRRAYGLYREVLKNQSVSLGKHDTETLKTKHNMASSLLLLGRINEALNIFEQVLEMYYELGDSDCCELRLSIDYTKKLFKGMKAQSAQTLHVAIEKNASLEDITSLVEETGIDINIGDANGRTPLHKAAEKELSDIALYLLGNGANYTAECKFGNTPFEVTNCLPLKSLLSALQTAFENAKSGDHDQLSTILSSGDLDGGVNARDGDGNTLLHWMSNVGHPEMVTALLNAEADATVANFGGETPLHLAVSRDHLDVAKLLVQSVEGKKRVKRFLDAKTVAEGRAALHIAASRDSVAMVRLLLRYGAYFNIRDVNGVTPRELTTDSACSSLLEVVSDVFRTGHFCNSLGAVGSSIEVDEDKGYFVSKMYLDK